MKKNPFIYIVIVIVILICGGIFIYNLKKPVPIIQEPAAPAEIPQPKIQPSEVVKKPIKSVETKDRNEDGEPDVWLYYNENKEHIKSEADRDYDGKPDTFRYYVDGKIDREEGDADLDGKIDAWAYYSGGIKVRAERDTNKDGKPDIFVYYESNQMVGVEKDTDFDGKIDETIGKIHTEKSP